MARAVATAKDAPTSELGRQQSATSTAIFGSGLVGDIDETERNRDLRWPHNLKRYDLMRTDAQIEALCTAVELSVRRRIWAIDPNGHESDDPIVQDISAELGLPVAVRDSQGRLRLDRASLPPRRRMRGRFSWDRHLSHVLRAPLGYGHYAFEQVGYIGDDGRWHLRKLAPRPPRTITRFERADDGNLVAIWQTGGRPARGGLAGITQHGTPIPIERLILYVWDQEGSNWAGRSMLRSIYSEWFDKNENRKTELARNRRNGMGVPIMEVTDPSVGRKAQEEALEVAVRLRAGEAAGAVTPYGIKQRLMGVEGTLPDIDKSIRRSDEAMARRFLAMVTMLGQTASGSRALGEVDLEFFAMGLDTIAGWAADVTNEHHVEDHVDWNYGEAVEFVPLVTSLAPDPEQVAGELGTMVESGALTVDEGIRDEIRSAGRQGSSRRRPFRHAAALTIRSGETERTLRREPNPHEVAAATDFEAIEQAYIDAVDQLAAAIAEVRGQQIEDVVAQVREAAGDLAALAAVTVAAGGAEPIRDALQAIARRGAEQVRAEAAAQGVDVTDVDLDELDEVLGERAGVLAQSLADDVQATARRTAERLTSLEGVTDVERVRERLDGMAWQQANRDLRGALQAGQNGGRFTAMEAAEQLADTSRIYHSSLLDGNTCGACVSKDGDEYVDLQDVWASFAGTGGYAFCEGGSACRCTAVQVLGESEATVQ